MNIDLFESINNLIVDEKYNQDYIFISFLIKKFEVNFIYLIWSKFIKHFDLKYILCDFKLIPFV